MTMLVHCLLSISFILLKTTAWSENKEIQLTNTNNSF